MLIYPAAPDITATPFKVFLSTKLRLYKDAQIVSDGLKHPLVVFSHGLAATAPAMLGSVDAGVARLSGRWSTIIGPIHLIRAHCMCVTGSGNDHAM